MPIQLSVWNKMGKKNNEDLLTCSTFIQGKKYESIFDFEKEPRANEANASQVCINNAGSQETMTTQINRQRKLFLFQDFVPPHPVSPPPSCL